MPDHQLWSLPNKWQAPFTIEQVQALNEWQYDSQHHPYTCGKCGSVLVPEVDGMRCPAGDGSRQTWAHACNSAGRVPSRGEITLMQGIVQKAITLRGCRAALDKAAADVKSRDFMGQLREREGLAGRDLDMAVDAYRAITSRKVHDDD